MPSKVKVETIEEYVARGGSIKKIPAQTLKEKEEVIKKSSGGPVTILSLDDADLFYGESKPVTATKNKSSVKIDLNALPEQLRNKFINRLRNEEYDGEENEDEEG